MTSSTTENEADDTDVKCPACKVEAGEECVSVKTGRPLKHGRVHNQRGRGPCGLAWRRHRSQDLEPIRAPPRALDLEPIRASLLADVQLLASVVPLLEQSAHLALVAETIRKDIIAAERWRAYLKEKKRKAAERRAQAFGPGPRRKRKRKARTEPAEPAPELDL